MKQSSIFSFVAKGGLAPHTPVVDLFCGIGGFSTGAKEAGHNIALAVDCDPFLLGAHVRNHPEAEHVCVSLPCDCLPLPKSGDWHIHGSPPCQKLSIMQPMQTKEDREEAIDMVEWFLTFALSSSATSWSMEQVAHRRVVQKLEILKQRHPLKVDFLVLDAVDFQVPQNRRRIIGGSPFLINNLRIFKSLKRKRRSIRDVFSDPPADYIRNSLYSRPDPVTKECVAVPAKDQIRTIDKPSFTVLATGHLKWADGDGVVLRHFRAAEKAVLQTFPENYKLPWNSEIALIGIGNAIPPALARVLMTPTSNRVKQHE